jgi:hypothetical protein
MMSVRGEDENKMWRLVTFFGGYLFLVILVYLVIQTAPDLTSREFVQVQDNVLLLTLLALEAVSERYRNRGLDGHGRM